MLNNLLVISKNKIDADTLKPIMKQRGGLNSTTWGKSPAVGFSRLNRERRQQKSFID